MARTSDFPPGAPVWVDLMSSDLEVSQAFYCGLLGWEVEPAGAGFGGYVNFTLDGARTAGAMPKPADAAFPDSWMVYLASSDCEATLVAAEAAGGQVHHAAHPVGDLGVLGIVADASGAVTGVWQPGAHRGFGRIDEPGAPAGFELHATDFDASVAFLRDTFGVAVQPSEEIPGVRHCTLLAGGAPGATVFDAVPHQPPGTPPHWIVYFRVADLDAAAAKVPELGGQVVFPPFETPIGRLCVVADATGATFELIER